MVDSLPCPFRIPRASLASFQGPVSGWERQEVAKLIAINCPIFSGWLSATILPGSVVYVDLYLH